jgi:hypothetical protein
VGPAQNVGEEVWRRPRWLSPTALQIARSTANATEAAVDIDRCPFVDLDGNQTIHEGNGRDQSELA